MKLPQWMEDLWQEAQPSRQQEFSQDLQWSSEAKRILEDPLIVRFFAITEGQLYKKWIESEPSQIKEREAAYEMLYLTRKFKEYLEQFLLNEEYALQQLAEMGKDE